MFPRALLPRCGRVFRAQLHSNATTETDFLQLNTTLPPFDDVRVRQALNLAIDRRAVVRIYGGRMRRRRRARCCRRAFSATAATARSPAPAGRAGRERTCAAQHWPPRAAAEPRHRLGLDRRPDDPPASRPLHGRRAPRARLPRPRALRLARGASTRRPPRSHPDDPGRLAGASAYNFFAPWFSCTGALNSGWFCDPRSIARSRRPMSLEAANPRAAARSGPGSTAPRSTRPPGCRCQPAPGRLRLGARPELPVPPVPGASSPTSWWWSN